MLRDVCKLGRQEGSKKSGLNTSLEEDDTNGGCEVSRSRVKLAGQGQKSFKAEAQVPSMAHL